MKKLQQLLTSAIFTTALLMASVTTNAQDNLNTQQPAQAAQVGGVETLPKASTPSDITKATPSVTQKKVAQPVQIVMPENASKKQAKQINRVNKMLAKASEQQISGTTKEPTQAQKVASQLALKKLTKKLDKMGVEETKEIRAIKEASAAKAVSNTVLISIILLALGIIFLLVPGWTLVGLVLLIIGFVFLLVGIA